MRKRFYTDTEQRAFDKGLNPKLLGHIVDDFENKTETFVPAKSVELETCDLDVEIPEWHKSKFGNVSEWEVYRKLLEEIGELGEAMAIKPENVTLELGDVMVCLTVLNHKLNNDLEYARKIAHEKNLLRGNNFKKDIKIESQGK